MARCNNEVLMQKIGMRPIDDTREVEFAVLRQLPECNRINTKNIVSSTGDYSYSAYIVPDNKFECMRDGCVNTGTLSVTLKDGASTHATIFKSKMDATQFAAGIITFYVKPASDATYPISVDVAISSAESFSAYDSYTISVTEDMVGSDGFAPVVVDLSSTPTSVTGGGWNPVEAGALIRVTGSVPFGISSISIYDTVEDFETSDVVKVACLSALDGTFDIPVSDASCFGAEWNIDDVSFDRTITGNAVTPNYWLLNPMHGKGTKTTSSMGVNVERTVSESGDFGIVTLGDLNQEECGFMGIQIADHCNVTDAHLKQLSFPSSIAIDEKHYFVVKNADGTSTIYFNKNLVGLDVIIAYSKIVEVESHVGNLVNVGDVKTRMRYVRCYSDGTKYIRTYNNVFVTSFPDAIPADGEGEFSFTVSIQPDEDGNYYTDDRVLD